MRIRSSLAFSLLLALVCCLVAVAPAGRAAAAPPTDTATVTTPVGSAAPPPDDPVLWPEAQREFFQDGPQLLLSDAQRGTLTHMDVGARQRWIDEFLARAPGSGTEAATLRQGITRRQALAAHEYVSPLDVRSQLLFLNGKPSARTVLDCGTTFKPIEVWTWRSGTAPSSSSGSSGTSAASGMSAAGSTGAGSIIIFRPTEDEPYRAWSRSESKRELYSQEMQYWLEQWDEMHGVMVGKRFDLRLCKEAELIDRVSGIPGLTGGKKRQQSEEAVVNSGYARRPGGQPGETLIDPPSDLAEWSRQAAATPLATTAPPLTVPRVDLLFPERTGQRMVVRAIVETVANGRVAAPDAGAGAAGASDEKDAGDSKPAQSPNAVKSSGKEAAAVTATAAGEPAKTQVGLSVEGAVEEAGKVFETFRTRFRLPAPAAGQPVSIAVERSLRPHRAFVLRLRIHDDGNGAETVVARGFVVPAQPTAPPPAPALAAGAAGAGGAAVAAMAGSGAAASRAQQAQRQAALTSPDTIALVAPDDDVVFGLWRAEALVTGNRIAKVAFSVDDKQQYARHTPPYSVELRLNRVPSQQVVRADGFDAQGQLVASDQLVLNEPHGGLAVSIQEPPRGARPAGNRVKAVADVTVPSERRVEEVEFRVNDKVVVKLTKPPWTTEVVVPADTDTVYLTVSARLDDGSRAEDVRFLRSPAVVEEVAVNLVELYTTVTDGSGQLVHGLTGDDFQVLENGQQQTLAKFELVENLPLTLGILIDTSGSMASSLGEAQQAAGSFLQRMVRQGDRCFTLTFSDRPVLRMPLTDDPRAAAQSIERLQADGSTSIHDALVHSLYYFRGTHGQRAIVLLSDGDDNTSQLTFDETLEYAKRSGVSIYTIGLNIPAHQIGIRGKLNHLSEATGGKVFFVGKATELAGIYSEIERELRSRYLLAFQTAQQAGAGGYRQIEVKMKKSGLKARTARGYYP